MSAPETRVARFGPIGALVGFSVLALFLDGLAGATAGVVVAAVLLARLPLRTIGALGVACLVAVPISVAIDGVPSADELSPAFVARSLWPHHLTFVGLALVGAWVVIEVLGLDGREPMVAAPGEGDTEGPEPAVASASRAVRIGIVAVVAVAALAACVAVVLA